MSRELQIFLSSTVDDLKDVRADIKRRMMTSGRLVRCSEDPGFPVQPMRTSHDACLEVIRYCHVYILLIHSRYGGEYRDQNKSITWREWEEARAVGITPIVLILKETNEACKQVANDRRSLRMADQSKSVRDEDGALNATHESQTSIKNVASLQRFVDSVRKGHEDNWAKLDWDGTADQALDYIECQIAVQSATSEQRRRDEMVERVAMTRTMDALRFLTKTSFVLVGQLRSKQVSRAKALEALLIQATTFNRDLFGFEDERYGLVIHLVEASSTAGGPMVLKPVARVVHPALSPVGRDWPVNKGHMGRSFTSNQLMVSGDIRHTEAWDHTTAQARDPDNYVSVMTRPLYAPDSKTPVGTITVSSSRLDHFMSEGDSAARAFDSLASLSNLLVLEVP
ncbi:MAG: DUF4062 domain-containing protein [Myxococcales bacterium]|nr:DUF4062 domain-containing protein [Myxococcales bacterium]